MTIAADDIVRVDLIGDNDGGDDIVNSFQMRNIGYAWVTDEQGLDDLLEWAEALLEILNDVLATVTKWRKIHVFNKTQDVVVGEIAIVDNPNGTLAGDPLPAGVCYLTSFLTTVPHVRLRKFWGMGAESECTAAGNVTAASLIILADVADFLLTDFIATNTTWQYGYDSPKALGWVVPSSAGLTNIFAYQRRRRPGTGE